MIVYLVATEPAEDALFNEGLQEHDLVAVKRLAEVGEDAEIVSVFITEPVEAAFLAAHPRLRMIATRSSSVDHLDLAACAAHKVVVAHVPRYSDTAVAEHTFALLLAVARRLREVIELPRTAAFSYEANRGVELHGKTLGIIGMGNVGKRVAALANGFAMQVIAYDVDPAPTGAGGPDFKFVSLAELLSRSDVISLHASLSPATYQIINRETLAQMQPGVLIINTARGALLDTAALGEALEAGQVGGAGLDVLEDERLLRQPVESVISEGILRHLRSDEAAHEARDANRVAELEELMLRNAVLARRNVIFTPHIAFNSVEATRRLTEATIENIAAFTAGKPMRTVLPRSAVRG